MSKKILSYIEQYLTKKIGTEIKCCLTFFLILCFYCLYRWVGGLTEAGIIHMLEMILLAYVLQWIQVLIHADFDEVDCLGLKEWMVILLGSLIYAFVGHIGKWFDNSIAVSIAFWFYMVIAYLCTFLIYKIKRVIDAKLLNMDLKYFKERLRESENVGEEL